MWNGQGDWVAACDTEFAPILTVQAAAQNQPTSNPYGRPQVSAHSIDNRFVLALVAAPIVIVLIEVLSGQNLFWLAVFVNIGLCLLDEYRLDKTGHQSPAKW